MPVTKKKGAIFAIYADSPSRDPSGASSGTTNPESRSRSPSKRPSAGGIAGQTSRKALSSVQPRSIGFPSAPPSALRPKSTTADGPLKSSKAALDSDFPLKPTPKHLGAVESTNPKSLAASRRSNPPPPPKTGPSKRQLEIFSSTSAPQPHSITSSRPIPNTSNSTSTGASASASAFPSTSQQPVSPAKRTRSSPTKPEVQYDKENHPPSALDSPASRTRSRTRLSLSAVPASPAITTKNRLIPRGEGKSASSPKTTAPKASTSGLQSREVRADGALADVSEAYGASGAEPDGFKTQGR